MEAIGSKGGTRIARGLTVAVAMCFMVGAIATSALANHAGLPGSNFEINDGNLKVDDPGHDDWANVAFASKNDLDSGQNDDSFGQGADENTPCPSVVSGSIPPNKSDLTQFGLYLEQTGTKSFLHMFWKRVQDPKGTTNMDFEFNQNDPAEVPCSNGVTPVRKAGDMLVTYNLSKGGTVPSFFVHRWIQTGTSAKDECEAGNKFPCWSTGISLSDSGDAAGSVNTEFIPVGEGGPLDAFTFGEGSVDLSAIFPENECINFGSAYLKSRSSDSFTSALKDFIAPMDFEIRNCGAMRIIKEDADDGTKLDGAVFKIYRDNSDGDQNDVENTFDPGGDDVLVAECTTGLKETDPGVSGDGGNSDGSSADDGECRVFDLLFGKYWVVEDEAPTGYTGDPIPRLVEVPDETLVVVTFLNQRILGSLTVEKTGDDGALLDGVKFTLTGTSDFGSTVDLECVTGTSNSDGSVPSTGECSFVDVEPGTYSLDEDETSLPAGYSKDPTLPKNVTIEANETTTVTVENPRTHRVLVIVCHEGSDTLLETDVENGAESKESISSVPAHLAAKGVTEADLCNTGGASFGGLGHTDKTTTAKLSTAHS